MKRIRLLHLVTYLASWLGLLALSACVKSGSKSDVAAPPTPVVGATCADGTPLGQCSKSAPSICDSSGNLIEDRYACGSAGSLTFAPLAKATQALFQSGAVHTNKYGTRMTRYSSDQSYFPIWMYGVKHPKTAYLCHPEEAGKAWRSESDPRVTPGALLKNAGFNAAQHWGESDSTQAFFNDVVRNDLQALMYWKPFTDDLYSDGTIFNFVRQNGQHKNILAWLPTEETGSYLNLYLTPDRPTVNSWLTFFANLTRQFRALSTRPVVHIDNMWVSNQTESSARKVDLDLWHAWNDPSDIIILDIYPAHLKTLQTLDTVSGLARASEYIQSTYAQTKPYWVMLGAFEEEPTAGAEKIMEFPSPVQMRTMAYTAIVHGATGIGYFAMDDYAMRKSKMIGVRPDTPTAYLNQGACAGSNWSDMLVVSSAKAQESRDLWAAIAKTNLEIQQLAPVILSYTSQYFYRVDLANRGISTTPIRAMLKESDGYFYLIAVNIDRAKITASFVTEVAASAADKVEVLFENRFIRPAQKPVGSETGNFVDEFGEFATHVYRWPVKKVTR